jgi:pimeloyl-ACP methyl ester carboxylesterase
VHGTADDVVPLSVAESFVAAARAAGEDVGLEVFDAGDHMGHIEPPDPMWGATADWLEPWRTS